MTDNMEPLLRWILAYLRLVFCAFNDCDYLFMEWKTMFAYLDVKSTTRYTIYILELRFIHGQRGI